MSYRLNEYVKQIKEQLMKNGFWERDEVLKQKLENLFRDQPMLTKQLVVGENIHYVSQLDFRAFRNALQTLKIDVQVLLRLFSSQLLRWELLTQSQRVWRDVKDFAETLRVLSFEEYKRAVELVIIPSTAYRHSGNQVFFNGCVLPLEKFRIQDVQYRQEPQEFMLNQPGHNVRDVTVHLFGKQPTLLIDQPGEQHLILTVWYENESLPWTYDQTAYKQQLFYPRKPIQKFRLEQSIGVQQIYTLQDLPREVSVTFHVGRPHVQPKTMRYDLKASSNRESMIRLTVDGLQTDWQETVSCDQPLPSLSGRDKFQACVLRGKFDPEQQYLTGQRYEDGRFVQYQVCDGQELPEGVEAYELHSMLKTRKPNGLCVLVFQTFQQVVDFNRRVQTYAYQIPVFREVAR